KAKLVGITVILQEESYTSKASFLDGDPIPTYRANQTEHPMFSGKRITRSWYRAKDGTIIHADINGSYNILRKSSSDPSQLGRGVGGPQFSLDGWPSKQMTDRRICHHFKILSPG